VWHVPLAQVWMSCADICPLWKNILSLNRFLMKKITQKFNISLTIGLKILKLPSRNLTHQRLSSSTKSLPQFLSINLYMISLNFKWQKCSIFHNCCTSILHFIKPPWWTLLHWGLKPSVARGEGDNMILEISMWQTNKTNKPLSSIDQWNDGSGCWVIITK